MRTLSKKHGIEPMKCDFRVFDAFVLDSVHSRTCMPSQVSAVHLTKIALTSLTFGIQNFSQQGRSGTASKRTAGPARPTEGPILIWGCSCPNLPC